MENNELHHKPASRASQADKLLARVLARAGWEVRSQPGGSRGHRPDLVARRGALSYAVEIKAAPEGRGDRLVPLWSQAYLQALRAAGDRHSPLAVVAAPLIKPSVAESVLSFASEYAPNAAAGVMDFDGLYLFRGPSLENLKSIPRRALPPSAAGKRVDLFSDLNQWMLKVLLAPELPEHLLSARRDDIPNASSLARAAHVSVMSAFRFVQLLRAEGYLEESESRLNVVRREDLFRRWQSWYAARPVHEVSMRFVLRGDPRKEMHRLLSAERLCLGLFAAADALGFGFVHGVPPHAYVDRHGPRGVSKWKGIVRADPGETPDLILRRAPVPKSVFGGMVRAADQPVSDILQVWLDVSAHPSRGREQAALIRRRVLDRVIEGRPSSG